MGNLDLHWNLVLKELRDYRFVFRTVKSMAWESGLTEWEVQKALDRNEQAVWRYGNLDNGLKNDVYRLKERGINLKVFWYRLCLYCSM